MEHSHICPLCEATCGLSITTDQGVVTGIRGDADDPFSRGYMCPKGFALKALHEDPDRLRAPHVRVDQEWREVSWDEAFQELERRLLPLLKEKGPQALAIYLGNPNVHTLSGQLYVPALLKVLKTPNIFTASTLDQMPKHVASNFLFGHALSVAVPDIDRCQHLLVLGANPLVSNGSMMTVPDIKGRLRGLRARGGKLVVIDPRRTQTAQQADEHHFIRPGSDAFLLMGMVHTLFAEGLVRPGRLLEHLEGLDVVRELCQDFSPEAVSRRCSIEAEEIRRLTRELAQSPAAAVYGRLGTCTQEFGTLASWLVDVLNILTGNLDRPGGAMFPKAAAGARNTGGPPGRGREPRENKTKIVSRVRGLPQVMGEFPTVALAEEILTPGPGQVRALLTIAGNPALSAPGAEAIERALGDLEFMVSIDCYLNETTRHADIILPPPSPLERSHYDLVFSQLAVHNFARYAPPVLARGPQQLEEWEILLRLGGILAGQGRSIPLSMLDDFLASQLIEKEVKLTGSRVEGRDPAELLQSLAPRQGPERLIDFLIRTGPYGDAFGADGLTLAEIEAAPHGLDLGPLQERIPELLRTASGKIELARTPLVEDTQRLRAGLDLPQPPLVLIGRRDLRSNNSWMHNLAVLTKGPQVCTLLVHPDDALAHGVRAGDKAEISSSAGSLEVTVEVSPSIMPGVVSLPHGWGHDRPGTRQAVARGKAGVNVNRLVPVAQVDPLSGNAIQNAIPVVLKSIS